MVSAIFSILGAIATYYSLKPFLKTKENRIKIIKWLLMLYLFAFLLYLLFLFIKNHNEVESFSKGVELLKANKEIINKIGSFKSYSFYGSWIPRKTDNPASFRVSLKGDSAEIYLSCTVKKDTLGVWHLVRIQQDSLIKVKN
jgi:Ca2+/Na+ antiporter